VIKNTLQGSFAKQFMSGEIFDYHYKYTAGSTIKEFLKYVNTWPSCG